MNKIEQQVREFHKEFELPIASEVRILAYPVHINRISLIQEELAEYAKALASNDLGKVVDGLGDLLYVVVGAFIEHGIPVEEVMDEIHKSNMSKVGGYIDEAGKYVKPIKYDKPDFSGIINE